MIATDPSRRRRFSRLFAVLFMLTFCAAVAGAVPVTVTVENLGPENGYFVTPVWVAAHAGDFDTFDVGAAASPEVERIAEDGAIDPIAALFELESDGMDAIATAGGPFGPGAVVRATLELDPENPAHRYLSYLAMVVPSNDAFIGNSDPMALPIFDELGAFRGGSYIVYGDSVYDAGTEVNDEVPANTAFFGQSSPDTGTPEGGVVSPHPGLLGAGSGGIVDDADFAEADFTTFGRRVVRITISRAVRLNVSITNMAPADGSYLSPFWLGLHDGSFDLYDRGEAAGEAIERMAEDASSDALSADFAASGAGMIEARVPGPNGPIAPGETATMSFTVDGTFDYNRYFSFASMVVPSNDAFIANGDPHAFPLFDDRGQPRLGTYYIAGNDVLDAGTEVNDEVPMNTAFFGQMTPDTGDTEGGVVSLHPGLMPPGSGGIVDDTDFAGADFARNGYTVARIEVRTEGERAHRLRDRFRISATATDFEGEEYTARVVPVSDESVFLYFFDEENVELLLKVIDGCTFNERYWVFTSGLTNVGVEVMVEDLVSGQTFRVSNSLGETFEPILDTSAFATCP